MKMGIYYQQSWLLVNHTENTSNPRGSKARFRCFESQQSNIMLLSCIKKQAATVSETISYQRPSRIGEQQDQQMIKHHLQLISVAHTFNQQPSLKINDYTEEFSQALRAFLYAQNHPTFQPFRPHLPIQTLVFIIICLYGKHFIPVKCDFICSEVGPHLVGIKSLRINAVRWDESWKLGQNR